MLIPLSVSLNVLFTCDTRGVPSPILAIYLHFLTNNNNFRIIAMYLYFANVVITYYC